MYKKIISGIVALAMVFGVAVVPAVQNADSSAVITASAEEYGDYEYTVLDDGTVEITGYNGDATEIEIPAEIGGKPVASIGDFAFSHYFDLVSVTLPESLVRLGKSAFGDPNVQTGDDNSSGLPNLETVVFKGNNLEYIGDSAFAGAENLRSISLPDSVEYIGPCAFLGTGLRSIEIPAGVKEIYMWTFMGCDDLSEVILHEGLESISESWTFMDCVSLESITIPRSVTDIEDNTFQTGGYDDVDDIFYFNNLDITIYCYAGSAAEQYAIDNEFDYILIDDSGNYEYIILDDGTVEITGYNGDATAIEIPAEIDGKPVTSIGRTAFSYNFDLVSVTLPESLVSIGYAAFGDPNTWTGDDGTAGLYNLKSVTFKGNNLKYIDDNAFAGAGLTSIDLPDSVEYIGEEAFAGADLVSVTIPAGVTRIEDFSFAYCRYLKSLTLHDNVTSIGYDMLDGCISLESLVIPRSVTEIEDIDGYTLMGGWRAGYSDRSTATIYCYAGSYAEEYLIERGLDYILIDENAEEPVETTTITDSDTDISVSYTTGVLPEGTKLNVIAGEKTETTVVYDITLTDAEGNKIQPNGYVTVKLPLPEGWENAYVYHVDDNGDYEPLMSVCVVDGYVTFRTNHFSPYILSADGELDDIVLPDNTEDDNTTTVPDTTDDTNTPDDTEKDDTTSPDDDNTTTSDDDKKDDNKGDSTSANDKNSTSAADGIDKNVPTGATAGLALAGLALAGIAVVATKKNK